ncbi:hypothetical protein SJI18_24535, partial [Clostridium frigoriphilum]
FGGVLLTKGLGKVSSVSKAGEAVDVEKNVLKVDKGVDTAKFIYKNNPMDNPKAAKDIIENQEAVYGFLPNPESKRIGKFADEDVYDWTNSDEVAKYAKVREEYHVDNDNIPNMVNKLRREGASEEEMAGAAVNLRNQIRLDSYLSRGDINGYNIVLKSNLDTYKDSLGMTPKMALEKYGSWDAVIEKTTSTNPGMDACCGLYDKYYHLYDIKKK